MWTAKALNCILKKGSHCYVIYFMAHFFVMRFFSNCVDATLSCDNLLTLKRCSHKCQKSKGKNLNFFHCWEFLKSHPKWELRNVEATPKSPTSSQDPEDGDDVRENRVEE